MEPWKWALVPILLIATYTDWRWQKIFNWLTFPAIGLGLLASGTAGALVGGEREALRHVISGLLGFGALAGVFLVLALLGGMKGGDLKLMAAVGIWLGWPLAVSALLYVAIVGGLFSLVWATAHGVLPKALRQIRGFFYAWLGGLNPTGMIAESAAPPFPYGVSITIGTMLSLLLPPLIAVPGLWR